MVSSWIYVLFFNCSNKQNFNKSGAMHCNNFVNNIIHEDLCCWLPNNTAKR